MAFTISPAEVFGVVCDVASSVEWRLQYDERSDVGISQPRTSVQGIITAANFTAISGSPPVGSDRTLVFVKLINTSLATVNVSFGTFDATVPYGPVPDPNFFQLSATTALLPQERLVFIDGIGFSVYDEFGLTKLSLVPFPTDPRIGPNPLVQATNTPAFTTSTAAVMDWTYEFHEVFGGAAITPIKYGAANGQVTSVGLTALNLAAPALGFTRITDLITVQNHDPVLSQRLIFGFVTFLHPTTFVNGSPSILLAPGEIMVFQPPNGYDVYDVNGLRRSSPNGFTGPTGATGPVGPPGPTGPPYTLATTFTTPVTGFGAVILSSAANEIVYAMNPAGTLATGTLTMPSAPTPGQKVTISSSETITTFTLNPAVGQSILGAPTRLTAPAAHTAGSAVEFVWNAVNSTWYRLS